MKSWTAVVVALIAGGAFVVGKSVERTPVKDESPMTVSVTGDAKVSAPPDVAALTFGVTTATLPTTKEAMADLSSRMHAAVAAVKGEEVAEKDMKTVHFSLREVYHYPEKSNERIHDGWAASEQLLVTVRDLARVGSILQAAVSDGANQAGDISFRIEDPEALRATARAQAVTEAKKKAKALAGLLGKTLGALKGYSESSGSRDEPRMMRAMADSASAAPPILGGEDDVNVSVTLTYELK